MDPGRQPASNRLLPVFIYAYVWQQTVTHDCFSGLTHLIGAHYANVLRRKGTLGWKEPGNWETIGKSCAGGGRRRKRWPDEAKRSLAVATAAKYRPVASNQIKRVGGWNFQPCSVTLESSAPCITELLFLQQPTCCRSLEHQRWASAKLGVQQSFWAPALPDLLLGTGWAGWSPTMNELCCAQRRLWDAGMRFRASPCPAQWGGRGLSVTVDL